MRWAAAFLSLAMLTGAPGAYAQQKAPPSAQANIQDVFPTGKPESGKFVVEYVYNYTVRPYEPPVTFVPATRNNTNRASPEEAFISHFSAMVAKDYDWWISGWTAESRASIEGRNRQMNRGPDTWTRTWEQAMKGQSIHLMKRVESGPFVFIAYRMLDAGGKTTLESMYVCKRVGNEWLATEELAEDPMFHHFQEGQKHITLNVR